MCRLYFDSLIGHITSVPLTLRNRLNEGPGWCRGLYLRSVAQKYLATGTVPTRLSQALRHTELATLATYRIELVLFLERQQTLDAERSSIRHSLERVPDLAFERSFVYSKVKCCSHPTIPVLIVITAWLTQTGPIYSCADLLRCHICRSLLLAEWIALHQRVCACLSKGNPARRLYAFRYIACVFRSAEQPLQDPDRYNVGQCFSVA